MATDSNGPLAGIRIVDLTTLAPGPFATMLLGDLGADVVTVEAPPSARAGSQYGTLPFHGGRRAREAGTNPLFRSRRSIVVDLKQPGGREVVLRLAATADVFVEGFRPGTAERLGIGYARVAAENPEIVYCSLSGYGQEGPYSGRAGHDLTYLAETGALAALTRSGQRPAIPLNVLADHSAGGLLAAFGILAALHGRAVSGRGTHVDTSMYEGLLALLQVVPTWTAAGAPDPSWGEGLLSGAVPFYDCYRTVDGRWIAVAALEPKFYEAVCNLLGRPDLKDGQYDVRRWNAVREGFAAAFGSETLSEWEARAAASDVPVAPVLSIGEAFERAERSDFTTDGQVRPVPRMSGWAPSARPVVTIPGLHTDEILAEAGFSGDRIERLLADGAVSRPV